MELMTSLGAWALGSVSSYTNNLLPGFIPGFTSTILSPVESTITADLGPRLSKNAAIFLPGSAQFADATDRWQRYMVPNITVVVDVATESDVQETIQYANSYKKSFLAVSGGHGATGSLGSVKHSIEIWMKQMNAVQISSDGQTATIDGGVKAKEVTDALWAANKQSVTGACECTGMVGPMLGGGHGFLQGRYGLMADNLIEARVVLSNGTVVVASSNSHPDLFWAIRGAGHNFGIVTQFSYKIYDVPSNNSWAWESFIYTADKVETLYAQINALTRTGAQVVELFNYSFFARMSAVDPINPVIVLVILYEGPASVEKQYSAPFHSFGPVMVQSGVATYPELPALVGADNNGPSCQHGSTVMRFPVGIDSYDPKTQRAVFDAFSAITLEEPAFNNSIFLFEGYALQGMKAVPASSTAFPHREDNLLVSPLIVYAPNAMLDPLAIKFGKQVRQMLQAGSGGSELHAYVNYAHGDESLQEMYGFEPWRQQKLRDLKRAYDPLGRFNFYAPIR